MTLELPFPPSVGVYWRALVRPKAKFPSFILSKRGREYKKLISQILNEQKVPKAFLSGAKLKVHLDLYPPDKRRRDIDNYTKSLFDCLTEAGIWADDSQIKDLTIQMKEPMPKPGKVKITINRIEVNYD